MQVILDTSVIVAAAISQYGASFRLIEMLDEAKFDAAISVALALEYEEILKREAGRTGWTEADAVRFADWFVSKASQYVIRLRLRPLLVDPDDDFIAELAFRAGVDYVVTHNVNDFKGSEAFGVRPITPGNFLAMLRGER